jgi:small-conductance mechanosensitive channel
LSKHLDCLSYGNFDRYQYIQGALIANSWNKYFVITINLLSYFLSRGLIVVPSISAYLPQLWRGAVVLSLVWFLRRWKDNSFSIVLANESILGLDKDKLSFLDKLLSFGLNLIAVMGLSETFNVGVQSILTFSGVGGSVPSY